MSKYKTIYDQWVPIYEEQSLDCLLHILPKVRKELQSLYTVTREGLTSQEGDILRDLFNSVSQRFTALFDVIENKRLALIDEKIDQ